MIPGSRHSYQEEEVSLMIRFTDFLCFLFVKRGKWCLQFLGKKPILDTIILLALIIFYNENSDTGNHLSISKTSSGIFNVYRCPALRDNHQIIASVIGNRFDIYFLIVLVTVPLCCLNEYHRCRNISKIINDVLRTSKPIKVQ